jgi:hypothetical protein
MLSVDNLEPATAVATLRQALEGLNTLSGQRAALEEGLKVGRCDRAGRGIGGSAAVRVCVCVWVGGWVGGGGDGWVGAGVGGWGRGWCVCGGGGGGGGARDGGAAGGVGVAARGGCSTKGCMRG